MKPSPEQVREWVAQIKSESGEGYTQELCELAAAWGAEQAQQTTDPLGFQIRRAIAAEDELRATKQTLEHAYAALQKVADAQAAIEEPALPEPVVAREEYAVGTGEFYTAAQMHDHFAAAKVREAQQWQTIDSAPKDGRCLVLVATDDGPCIERLDRDEKGNWLHEGEPTFCHSYYFKPTHWMPLPAAPKEQQ